MTTESDLRTPRDLSANAHRGRYHVPYVSVREHIPYSAAESLRPASHQFPTASGHYADIAQARLFADLLRAEHAELGAAAGLGARGRAAPCPPDQMVLLQARMREVRQLLEALEQRFPWS
ncbi:hypothetical protein [Mycobacterium ahvazicum]|uniref:hypothetical protein n=1 Tax=Mycobacterium ahvazicum TaxID=1964395 RepID=UPI0010575B2C|nr:hypothetical protein [Mycobacterium ahvazicum]